MHRPVVAVATTGRFDFGALGETRTRTARATAPSRQRVYQFHHQSVVGRLILLRFRRSLFQCRQINPVARWFQ